jgi:putative spermidine/putrescine transport system substrate-binding protein
VTTLRSRGVRIEFVKPETGAIAFFTTMHITKGAAEPENAYKYIDTVISKEVQTELMKAPNYFIPANKEVELADLPMTSLDEMSQYVRHDWSKLNPLREGWIERFNKEVAK